MNPIKTIELEANKIVDNLINNEFQYSQIQSILRMAKQIAIDKNRLEVGESIIESVKRMNEPYLIDK